LRNLSALCIASSAPMRCSAGAGCSKIAGFASITPTSSTLLSKHLLSRLVTVHLEGQETPFFLQEKPLWLPKSPGSQHPIACGVPKTGFLIYPLNPCHISKYPVNSGQGTDSLFRTPGATEAHIVALVVWSDPVAIGAVYILRYAEPPRSTCLSQKISGEWNRLWR